MPAGHRPAGHVVNADCLVVGRYDLIIGSDLLYERDECGELARFIDCHAAPAAEIWIVDPDRGNRPAFHRTMLQLGFGLEEIPLRCVAGDARAAYKGRCLIYRRHSGNTAA